MPNRVILKDAETNRWMLFDHPLCILTTSNLADVEEILKEVENMVKRKRWVAAGFLAYEAAPAFDEALKVFRKSSFPLIWFGLYERAGSFNFPRHSFKPQSPLFWKTTVNQQVYRENFLRIKNHISAGDCYQVNYSFRLKSKFCGDPWESFTNLVAMQPSPYSAFLETDTLAIISASPELFFSHKDNELISKPMKGTSGRGLNPGEDRLRAQALRTSAKERAENLMIVDMMRNDFGRVAETGSIHVPRLFSTEKHPTLWQMTSTVKARSKASLFSIMKALFPAASVTGAPKPRVMQIISKIETTPRRIYTGSIGFFLPNRRAQFNVAIRTIFVDKIRRQAEYGVGSGIVWDSDPEREYEECLTKAKILVDNADLADNDG